MKYDSKEEELFHQRHPNLIQCADKPYNFTFYDEQGTSFKAYPDFYSEELKCYIEFKCHQLNNKPDKNTADDHHQRQISFKGRDCIKYQLDNSWNHSLFKQAKVQSSLASLDIKILVVFKDGTKLTPQSINKMKAVGLVWFYEYEI